jgi:hypothetical protein
VQARRSGLYTAGACTDQNETALIINALKKENHL